VSDAGPAPVVTTTRLRLILLTPDDAADMVAGRRQSRWHPDYPARTDVDAASLVRPVAPGATPDPWGPRHVVLGHQAVGSIGFFGPPADGEVEVGYGLVADVRGQGLATEALTAILAETDRLGVRVRASVAPTNRASIRVLAATGFTDLRGSTEDGELVMARPLVAAASPGTTGGATS
jgi:[ribosomal protein S5]-alanine N-acetyltransferase